MWVKKGRGQNEEGRFRVEKQTSVKKHEIPLSDQNKARSQTISIGRAKYIGPLSVPHSHRGGKKSMTVFRPTKHFDDHYVCLFDNFGRFYKYNSTKISYSKIVK